MDSQQHDGPHRGSQASSSERYYLLAVLSSINPGDKHVPIADADGCDIVSAWMLHTGYVPLVAGSSYCLTGIMSDCCITLSTGLADGWDTSTEEIAARGKVLPDDRPPNELPLPCPGSCCSLINDWPHGDANEPARLISYFKESNNYFSICLHVTSLMYFFGFQTQYCGNTLLLKFFLTYFLLRFCSGQY